MSMNEGKDGYLLCRLGATTSANQLERDDTTCSSKCLFEPALLCSSVVLIVVCVVY